MYVAKFTNVPFPPILCNVTEASLTGLPDESVTVAVIVVVPAAAASVRQ